MEDYKKAMEDFDKATKRVEDKLDSVLKILEDASSKLKKHPKSIVINVPISGSEIRRFVREWILPEIIQR